MCEVVAFDRCDVGLGQDGRWLGDCTPKNLEWADPLVGNVLVQERPQVVNHCARCNIESITVGSAGTSQVLLHESTQPRCCDLFYGIGERNAVGSERRFVVGE